MKDIKMNRMIVRKKSLHDPDTIDDYEGWSPEELIGVMWFLTLNAWSFMMKIDAEPRLQRHVIVIKRGIKGSE